MAGDVEPTGRHRLFSQDRHDWVPTDELHVGEKLKTRDGFRAITSINHEAGVQRVYNLEVETEHDYYVSDGQILSHNVNPCAAGGGGSAANAMNGVRLNQQLASESANSAFTETGELSKDAITNSRQIIPNSALKNPAIKPGFSKYSTETYQSPSGDFQVHYYMNDITGEIDYSLDYKAVSNSR